MAGPQHSEDGPEQSREVPQRGRRQQARAPAGSWLVAEQLPGSKEREFGGSEGGRARTPVSSGSPGFQLPLTPCGTSLSSLSFAGPRRLLLPARRQEHSVHHCRESPVLLRWRSGPCPALPCPRPQPHPCFCHGLQTRGRSRGRADPPTASWAGACRGAAEPPPRPLTPRAGPLPPNLSLPQPLDLERLRGGWDPRVGQEGAPLPLGLTPVSREGRHQGSPGGGTAGRHAPGVGEDCL